MWKPYVYVFKTNYKDSLKYWSKFSWNSNGRKFKKNREDRRRKTEVWFREGKTGRGSWE